jgi:hypothetical protein
MYESELFCKPLGERDSLPICARTRSYSYAFPYCGTVSHPYFPSAHRGQRRYHIKKQNLNSQLYRLHLECAYQCNGVWQHIYNSIEIKLNHELDTLYHKLNKKLDALTKQSQTRHSNKKNWDTQQRLINLTHIPFQKEHINTLTLVPNYAIEKHPKQYINELIIDTENSIR